jgi:hypothetical protein
MLTKVSYSMITGASVNILDFGAVDDWDGTTGTDNKLAIQNALIYASTINADVIFPTKQTGIYAHSGIEVSGLNCAKLIGTGGRLFLKSNSNRPSIFLTNCGNVEVQYLYIDSNKIGQNLSVITNRNFGCSILVETFNTCRIHKNTLINTPCGAALAILDSSVTPNVRTHTNKSAEVSSNNIFDSGLGSGALITCDAMYTQCNNINIFSNIIIGYNDYGIVCEFGSNMHVYDNNIDGTSTGIYGVNFQGCFRFSSRGNDIRNTCGGVAVFVQSNPIADPFFNIFGDVDSNTVGSIGVPVFVGNNVGVNVLQGGPTVTIVARTNGAAGNAIALSSTGGTFTLPIGGTLANGAYGVPANGTIKLANVVAGNTLTVNGITYTGVASGATAVQFNIGLTDAITAANIASKIMQGLASVDAYSGSHVNVKNNTTETGDIGIVFTGDVGTVSNNSIGQTNLQEIFVNGWQVNLNQVLQSPYSTSYINAIEGTVDQLAGNNQSRTTTVYASTYPAYSRLFYVKTFDISGNHSCVVVINASGIHPTGSAPVFVQRRLLIKSVAGTITVVDFDAGPVGDITLITITAGQNGAGRAELLVRPSTGTMDINCSVYMTCLDKANPFFILEP